MRSSRERLKNAYFDLNVNNTDVVERRFSLSLAFPRSLRILKVLESDESRRFEHRERAQRRGRVGNKCYFGDGERRVKRRSFWTLTGSDDERYKCHSTVRCQSTTRS